MAWLWVSVNPAAKDIRLLVIPARGGSKRIPQKNIRLFHGKPLLAWPILAAQQSGLFDRIIVSTDSPDVSDVALEYGAEVPFMRPHELADDTSPTLPVVQHAIQFLKATNWNCTVVCCLYPGAVSTTGDLLVSGLRALRFSPDALFSCAVSGYAYPVQRSLVLDADGLLTMTQPQFYNTHSQDLVRHFHDAGQFYWADTETWLSETHMLTKVAPVYLPSWAVQDIDTEEDWKRAEIICELKERQAKSWSLEKIRRT